MRSQDCTLHYSASRGKTGVQGNLTKGLIATPRCIKVPVTLRADMRVSSHSVNVPPVRCERYFTDGIELDDLLTYAFTQFSSVEFNSDEMR